MRDIFWKYFVSSDLLIRGCFFFSVPRAPTGGGSWAVCGRASSLNLAAKLTDARAEMVCFSSFLCRGWLLRIFSLFDHYMPFHILLSPQSKPFNQSVEEVFHPILFATLDRWPAGQAHRRTPKGHAPRHSCLFW